METRMNNEIEILRQGLTGQRPVDEAVLTSAAILGDRLEMLKESIKITDDLREIEALFKE